jgi:phosphopantothenoylcysteine decarboxylase/phosphopantothenate--cysteine ligase
MGGARNRVAIISREGVEHWPDMAKDEVAERLVALIVGKFQ